MDTAELRNEIIRVAESCRAQGWGYDRVTTRYAQSMGGDKVQEWQEIYLQWSNDVAENVAIIRDLANEAPKDTAAKLLEAATLYGHGEENNRRAISLLSEAAACCQCVEVEFDGPVDGFRWRHNGVLVEDNMPPGAWRLSKHLFYAQDRTASYAELAPIVADDHSESFLDYENCRGHQTRANKYFRKHGIPLSISLRGQPTLEDT